MKPFLKWAGGKRHLLPHLLGLAPGFIKGTYWEPFLGGGAMFFALKAAGRIGGPVMLSDANSELICTYKQVQRNHMELLHDLADHFTDRRYFLRIRDEDPAKMSPLQVASRMIYLNKTCYRGLYRLNKKGKFNVNYGWDHKAVVCDVEGIKAASSALQGAKIQDIDFAHAEAAKPGDFVYFDSPYVPIKPGSFVNYGWGEFTAETHERLARLFRTLANRGVAVMLSNSDTPLVRELYADFQILNVRASRAINSRGDRRSERVGEVIVCGGTAK